MGERAIAHLKWRMGPYLPGSLNNSTPKLLQGPFGGPLPEYFVRHEDIDLAPNVINTAQPIDPSGSHGWGAVGMVWVHDSVLGVFWGKDGFEDQMLTIEPKYIGKEYFSGTVVTPLGEILIEKSGKTLSITLPTGAKAKVNGNCENCKKHGEYVFLEGAMMHKITLDY
jgi:hypothetical protein